jgi:hypothetical protein
LKRLSTTADALITRSEKIYERRSLMKTRNLTVFLFRTGIALAMLLTTNVSLFTASSFTVAAGACLPIVSAQEAPNAPHLPLASVGITLGQTARINVVNSPEPTSSVLPGPMTVEMCFHDANGNLVVDRLRRPVQKIATIDPHHGDSLDLNGNLVGGLAGRVVIIPCVRVLRIGEGSRPVPTVEIFSNLLKTSMVLNPGVARGFDPQPDPPVAPEIAFGMVGITEGTTARLYLINAQNPASTEPQTDVMVEMEIHDANGNQFLDRRGRPFRRTVTIEPDHSAFLELNGNDISIPGSKVGIIPCFKILNGARGSLVVPTFEMYLNITQQTLLLGNFVSDPHAPVEPPR